MTLFFLTFGILLLLVGAMSVGVIAGRGPIKGSCGGMSALGMDTECDICGGDPAKCDEAQAADGGESLSYDATKKQR